MLKNREHYTEEKYKTIDGVKVLLSIASRHNSRYDCENTTVNEKYSANPNHVNLSEANVLGQISSRGERDK